MPFQPVPSTAEVRCTYSSDLMPKLFVNLVYFNRPAGWDAATIQNLANEATLRFGTSLLPQNMSSDYQLIELRARDLSSEFGASAIGVGNPQAGADFGFFSNPQSAALVRFIASVGPPRRGGIFWPWVREDQVSTIGELDAAFRTTLEGRVRSWVEGVEIVTSSNHVIVSRYTRAVPPATGSVLRPVGVTALVTDYQTLRRVASQRDRRADLPGF